MENFDTFFAYISRLAKQINLRLTDKRVLILKALYKKNMPLKVSDIQAEIFLTYDKKVTQVSIYKFLNILTELQVLHILCLPPLGVRHYSLKHTKSQNYLVCIKCGKIVLFFDEVMNKQIKDALIKKDFILTNHRVILYGVCKECKNG